MPGVAHGRVLKNGLAFRPPRPFHAVLLQRAQERLWAHLLVKPVQHSTGIALRETGRRRVDLGLVVG